ncbi:uncharacterized protein LOC141711379 [Apium graveolens]|uniref:uncharacterized protein LOC141711379 n=1 Tax=Apium graveolens TaxID=4045 RepID=UPI003D79E826
MKKAKLFLKDDPKYQKGFKFDHVWHILKDSEKFSIPNTTPYVQCSSSNDDIRPNLSAFDINSTEEIGATSSVRPMRVKKAKEKRKRKHDELSLAEYKEENKILLKDLNSIFDLNLRKFIRTEQNRIMEKRAQQQRSTSRGRGSEDEGQGSQNDHNYNQYYDYLGGSRNNIFG